MPTETMHTSRLFGHSIWFRLPPFGSAWLLAPAPFGSAWHQWAGNRHVGTRFPCESADHTGTTPGVIYGMAINMGPTGLYAERPYARDYEMAINTGLTALRDIHTGYL